MLARCVENNSVMPKIGWTAFQMNQISRLRLQKKLPQNKMIFSNSILQKFYEKKTKTKQKKIYSFGKQTRSRVVRLYVVISDLKIIGIKKVLQIKKVSCGVWGKTKVDIYQHTKNKKTVRWKISLSHKKTKSRKTAWAIKQIAGPMKTHHVRTIITHCPQIHGL